MLCSSPWTPLLLASSTSTGKLLTLLALSLATNLILLPLTVTTTLETSNSNPGLTVLIKLDFLEMGSTTLAESLCKLLWVTPTTIRKDLPLRLESLPVTKLDVVPTPLELTATLSSLLLLLRL